MSVRRVQQLTQEGILNTTQIPTPNGRRATVYMLVETIQKYTEYCNNRANGRAATATEEALKKEKLEAEIAYKRLQADYNQIRLDRANGKLVDVEEELWPVLIKLFADIKKWAMNLPLRLTGMSSNLVEHSELRRFESRATQEVNDMLNSLIESITWKKPREERAKRGRPKKSPN